MFSIIWFINESPCLIYYNHIISMNTTSFIVTNSLFEKINTYFNNVVLLVCLPAFVTGLLAYNNIQQLSHRTVPFIRRELDKELTVMVLLQVVFNFFSIMPYCIMTILVSTNTSHDSDKHTRIQFVYILSICLYYTIFSVSIKLDQDNDEIFRLFFNQKRIEVYF
jgi:hypothetical protein